MAPRPAAHRAVLYRRHTNGDRRGNGNPALRDVTSGQEQTQRTAAELAGEAAIRRRNDKKQKRRAMGVSTGTTVPRTAGRPTASRISGLRRASFAAFVMLVVQFALGIYVNLYVTVPRADHGHGFGQAIANGPAGLTAHIGLGLLLILAALGFLVQAILARQPALIAAAVLGLLAMVGAAAAGSSFTGSGRDRASMAMAEQAAAGLP